MPAYPGYVLLFHKNTTFLFESLLSSAPSIQMKKYIFWVSSKEDSAKTLCMRTSLGRGRDRPRNQLYYRTRFVASIYKQKEWRKSPDRKLFQKNRNLLQVK